MNIDLETWLTRFAAGAGTLFEWHIIDAPSHLHDACPAQLRAVVYSPIDEDYTSLCPISAQATLDVGYMYHTAAWMNAAIRQGLDRIDAAGVTDAADEVKGHDPALRARLLRICRCTMTVFESQRGKEHA